MTTPISPEDLFADLHPPYSTIVADPPWMYQKDPGGKKHAAIASGIREPNVIDSRKTGHSQKPPAFFDLVERVSPGPYVELFARQPRLGWDAWGLGHESGAA